MVIKCKKFIPLNMNNFISFRIKVIVLVVHLCIAFGVFLLLSYTFLTQRDISQQNIGKYDGILKFLPSMKFILPNDKGLKTREYNIWLIFTKVGTNSPLKYKFHNLILNLLNVSSVPLRFNVVVDDVSWKIAFMEFGKISNNTMQGVSYIFYNFTEVASKIHDIVTVLTPHFSSRPGTYYSDALFYISLGLHKIAPTDQDLAVLLDCDLYFKDDVAILFKEFARFKSTALFGLAPELTPVYRHVLHMYRSKHTSTFGDYYHLKNISKTIHPLGFQGYNSGVVLLNLRKIRQSKTYPKLLSKSSVDVLAEKYNFRGHLGDQDFYTLIGYEYPDLIQTLNCGFNRQLCTWWKDHGYNDVFDNYFKCKHKIIVLHGNCNTPIPK